MHSFPQVYGHRKPVAQHIRRDLLVLSAEAVSINACRSRAAYHGATNQRIE